MPFKSEAQRRFLWAKHPDIARRWADKYGGKVATNEYRPRKGTRYSATRSQGDYVPRRTPPVDKTYAATRIPRQLQDKNIQKQLQGGNLRDAIGKRLMGMQARNARNPQPIKQGG